MTTRRPAVTTELSRQKTGVSLLDPLPRGIRYRIEYAIMRTLLGVFGFMKPEQAGAAGARLAKMVGSRTKLNERARENLATNLPDLPPETRDAILSGVWDSVGRTIGEYAHLHRFDFFTPDARVEIIGMDTVRDVMEMDRGGIFFSGHFANWELMPRAMVAAGLPCATVVRPVNNPHVEVYLDKLRRREVCPELIDKRSGAKRIFQVLRQKKFIAMLVDQKMTSGEPVDFFGQEAMTTTAPARLALKLGCPLIPAWIERTAPGRYALHVFKPLEIPNTGDAQADILAVTQDINHFLEERIREKPEEWMWLHNRWGRNA